MEGCKALLNDNRRHEKYLLSFLNQPMMHLPEINQPKKWKVVRHFSMTNYIMKNTYYRSMHTCQFAIIKCFHALKFTLIYTVCLLASSIPKMHCSF